MSDIEVLARRRLALVEQKEVIEQSIKAIDAQLIDAIEVGGAVVVGDTPVFRVSQRRTFDLNAAMQVVPPELIEAARVTVVDAKALKSMMPPALTEACMKPGKTYVAAVKA